MFFFRFKEQDSLIYSRLELDDRIAFSFPFSYWLKYFHGDQISFVFALSFKFGYIIQTEKLVTSVILSFY